MDERTVLLAAAQPLLRDGLKGVFAAHGLDVVADVDDATAAVDAAERHRPRVCVLDGDLPGGGIVAIRRITDRVAETSVVVLVSSVTADVVLAAVLAGANGIVSKSTTTAGLLRAVDSVVAGQTSIPRLALASLVHEIRGRGRNRASIEGRPFFLTARELQVLELLRETLTTAEVAAELGVSQVTVRRHLGAIAAKAGEGERKELLRLVRVV